MDDHDRQASDPAAGITPTTGTTSGAEKAAEKVGGHLVSLMQRAISDGVGPLTGSAAYAEARADGAVAVDPEATIQRIVRESVAASGTQGFVTGVGGLAALPITLPANVVGSLVINARMVGAIAHLRGYGLEDPRTQAVMTLVIAGSSAQSAASAVGVKIGQAAARQVIEAIPMTLIRQVNRRAGVYLVAKYGTQRSAITLAKAVPFVGGVVGGGVDAALTASVAKAAKKVFPPVVPMPAS